MKALTELERLLTTADPSSPLLNRLHPDWELAQARLAQLHAMADLGEPGDVSKGTGRHYKLKVSSR